jgi:hypothetical protein
MALYKRINVNYIYIYQFGSVHSGFLFFISSQPQDIYLALFLSSNSS